MNIENENVYYTAAEELAVAEKQRAYDNATKEFLSIKKVMAVILEQLDFLPEGYNRDKIEESINKFQSSPEGEMIELMGTEDHSPVGPVRYDLRFRLALPEDDAMVMNVEAQHNFPEMDVFVGRVGYYGGRLLSGQKGTVFQGTNYDQVNPVCSIWICQDMEQKHTDWENTVVYSKDREYVTHRGEPFDFGGAGKDYFKEIYIFLGGTEKVREKTVQDKLINFLNVSLSVDATVEERIAAMEEEGLRVTNVEKGAVNEMFDLASGIFKEGVRRGIKKARAEVREEVRAEVRAEVREEMQAESREAMREKYLELFKSLTEELGLSQEAAVKFLKLPKEEEENLLEDLQAEEKQESVGGVAGYVQAHKQETQQSMQDEEEVGR